MIFNYQTNTLFVAVSMYNVVIIMIIVAIVIVSAEMIYQLMILIYQLTMVYSTNYCNGDGYSNLG
jgi:hypothetical protein